MGSGIGAKSPDFSEVSRGPVQPGEAQGALTSGDLWALSGQPWSGPESEANALGRNGHH